MSGVQTHPQLSWNLLFRGSRPVDLLNLQFHGIVHHFLNRPSLCNQWSTNWRPVGEWESHLIFKMDQTLVTKKVRLIRTWLENMVSSRCWICPLVIPERKMWMELQTTCRFPYATGCPGTEKHWEKQRERERESHKDGQAAYTVCYRETGATREVRAPLHAFYSRAEAWVSECQVLIHHGVEGICKYSSLPPAWIWEGLKYLPLILGVKSRVSPLSLASKLFKK